MNINNTFIFILNRLANLELMQKHLNRNIYEKIKSGDESAFNQLFDEFYIVLCLFCCTYTSDMDKARSLVQQVFVDLWIKSEKLNITKSIKSYLYNAVKNKSIDYLRQQKNISQITPEIEFINETPFQDLIQEAEISERINTSINQLPEKCREIFILCRIDELKYNQVAKKLNISVKTVEMQMSIALKKLRVKLPDYIHFNLFALLISKKKTITATG